MASPNNSNNKNTDETEVDWAKKAEEAAKKAEEEVEQLKKDAHEQLNDSKTNYNNPSDEK